MRKTTSFDSSGTQPQARGKFSLFIVVMGVAHGILFSALDLNLPFDLDDLFQVGYALVILDGSLCGLIAIRLIRKAL